MRFLRCTGYLRYRICCDVSVMDTLASLAGSHEGRMGLEHTEVAERSAFAQPAEERACRACSRALLVPPGWLENVIQASS